MTQQLSSASILRKRLVELATEIREITSRYGGALSSNKSWAIDAVRGNDSGDGSPSSPLRTHAEFQKRLGLGSRIDDYVTVQVLSDLDEPIAPWFHIGATGSLNYVGAVSSTLAAGPANQAGDVVEMSGVSNWSPFVGEMIRDTVNGCVSWISATLANPAQARLSAGMIFDELSLSPVVASSISNGDMCVVERRVSVPGVDLSRITQDSIRGPGVTLFPVHVTGFRVSDRISHVAFPGVYQPLITRCSFSHYVNVYGGFPWYEQCRFFGSPVALVVSSGAYAKVGRVCLHNEARAAHGGVLWLSNNGLLQDAHVYVEMAGDLLLSNINCYGNPGTFGVRVAAGGRVQAYYAAPAGTLTAGTPLWVEGRGLFTYPSGQAPTLVGPSAGQDFRLGRLSASAQSWSALGSTGVVDPSTGAAILPYDP